MKLRSRKTEKNPCLVQYSSSELRSAAELFTSWLPFLTKDICSNCTCILSNRVRSLHPPESKNKVDSGTKSESVVTPEAKNQLVVSRRRNKSAVTVFVKNQLEVSGKKSKSIETSYDKNQLVGSTKTLSKSAPTSHDKNQLVGSRKTPATAYDKNQLVGLRKRYKTPKGYDRISSLPDAVIHHILSFIGHETLDLVQTFVVSQTWRNLWKLSPNLILEEKVDTDVEWWKVFVKQLLISLEKSDIKKLSFTSLFLDQSLLEMSIQFAIDHNVEYLQLSIDANQPWELPSSILTSTSLQVLHIKGNYYNRPTVKLSSGVSLHRVHTLYLERLRVNDEIINTLVSSSCPLLKYFSLVSCDGLNSLSLISDTIETFTIKYSLVYLLTITSKSLKKLRISNSIRHAGLVKLSAPSLWSFDWDDSMVNDYILDDCKSLSEVSVDLRVQIGVEDQNKIIYSLLKFLSQIANAQTLIINLSSTKYAKDGLLTLYGQNDLGMGLPTLLPNITNLKLQTGFGRYELPLIGFLLKNAPFLRCLTIEETTPLLCQDPDFEVKKQWEYIRENILSLNHLDVCKIRKYKKTVCHKVSRTVATTCSIFETDDYLDQIVNAS